MATTTRTKTTKTMTTTKTARTRTATRPDAATRVRQALLDHPGTTVPEIAAVADIGKSTAARVLVELEHGGHARRTRHDGRHNPDTWHPATDDAATDDAATSETADAADAAREAITPPGSTDGREATEREPASGADDPETMAQAATSANGDMEASAVDPVASGPAEPAMLPSGMPRLRSGALRDLVADYLAAHPDLDFTPTELSHKLGDRSSGAISNALDKLTASGQAMQVRDRPRRFQATSGAADSGGDGGPDAA